MIVPLSVFRGKRWEAERLEGEIVVQSVTFFSPGDMNYCSFPYARECHLNIHYFFSVADFQQHSVTITEAALNFSLLLHIRDRVNSVCFLEITVGCCVKYRAAFQNTFKYLKWYALSFVSFEFSSFTFRFKLCS